MSSLRNAVNRRVHRERDQLQDRKNRYGLLEKKKDYRLRAQDHNKKKEQLRNLKKKAEERNEDEFYFGMLSRKGPDTALSAGTKRWDGTVAGDRGNKALPMEVVRLLKTQDMGYIRSVRNVAMKEVRSLEERVIALGGDVHDLQADEEEDEEDDFDFNDFPTDSGKKGSGVRSKNKKIVFADAPDEREETIQRHLHTSSTSTTQESPQSGKDEEDDRDEKGDPVTLRAEQKQRLLEKLKRRLQNARKKRDVLAKAEHELEMQRARMAKTATVGGVTKAGKKIKIRERKR